MKKNIIKTIAFILIGGTLLYGLTISFGKINKPNLETDLKGKLKSKEEYLYKEDLLYIGYSVDEIRTIEYKVSSFDVKKYLLEKKYNNLINFLECENYKIELISKYQEYLNLNKDTSYQDVVDIINSL